MKTALRCDPNAIVEAVRLLVVAGNVVELRALDATMNGDRWPTTYSGYFDDPDKLAAAAASIRSAKGIYITVNPVDPALFARAANRIRKAPKGESTQDSNIIRRCWMLIDCDAVRPSGISATDAEHEVAIERCRAIFRYLKDCGWPDPIAGDSGNGGHLLYLIDLPADDGGLLQRCLVALAQRFDDAEVTVDQGVFNPARIWKLYGTPACKGDSTSDRPHRMSRILSVPADLRLVPMEMLEKLASEVKGESSAKTTPANRVNNQQRFDIESFMVRHFPGVQAEPWQGGRRWVLPTCPWNGDHANGSAYVLEMANGALAAGCHHNSCSGRTWTHLRAMFDRQTTPQRPAETATAEEKSWPDPQPLPAELPPVMAFTADLLPEMFRPWIMDIADRVQCPPDFPAVGAIIALAGVVGRKIGIRPKRHDIWLVVPNLWGAVIGRPGIMKTPALKEPLRPLQRLEIEAAKRFQEASQQHAAQKIVAELTRKAKQTDITKAIKANGDALGIAAAMLENEQEAPIRQRFIVNDSSVEKLGELLNQNSNGLTVYRDELIGLLRALDKEGQEGARAFYLEAWDGTGRYTYDRIGRGTIDIEAAIVSVIGGIQPGPLGEYVRGALGNGEGNDGLLQRFQLSVYPDVSREWINVDRWPDTPAKNCAYEVFTRLNYLDPLTIGAVRDADDPDGIPYLRFTNDAQDAFDSWRADLERKVRAGDEHPAIESHLAKYRSLIPSLALLFHLVDGVQGPVTIDALRRAIRWGAYLESHARRIYATAINPGAVAAKALAQRIVAGDLADGFALRDIYNNGWSLLSARDDAAAAATILTDLDWLEELSEPTPGRTRTRYRINPRVLEAPRQAASKTSKSPSAAFAGMPPKPIAETGNCANDDWGVVE